MNPELLAVDVIIDVVSAVFLVVGALMSLAAAIGILRFPDLLSRMHAATKPQVLGLFLLLASIGLQMRTLWVWPVLLVAWLFQLLTVPVSAHMMGRSGYRTKHLHREMLTTDELEAVVRSATLAARKDSTDSPHIVAAATDVVADVQDRAGATSSGPRADGADRELPG